MVVELSRVEVWGASGVLKFCRAPRRSVRRADVPVHVTGTGKLSYGTGTVPVRETSQFAGRATPP
jgi:hypothetical protein